MIELIDITDQEESNPSPEAAPPIAPKGKILKRSEGIDWVCDIGVISADQLGDLDWLDGPRPKPTPALLRWDDLPEARPPRHLLIPAGRVGLIVAPGGTGKSTLLCQLAVTVATGAPWLSTYALDGKPGRVLLIMGEEDQDEIKRKLYDAAHPAKELRAEQKADFYRNVECIPLSGVPCALLEHDEGSISSSHFSENLRELIAQAHKQGHPYKLIIMDPLSRMMGAASENDNAFATRFIQELEAFTQGPGAPTVLVAHHAHKGAISQAHSGEATNQGASRGASALVDGARLMINLEPCPAPDDLSGGWGGARITLRVTKSNYGPTPRALELIRPTGEQNFRPASPDELARWAQALPSPKKGKGKQTPPKPSKDEPASAALQRHGRKS